MNIDLDAGAEAPVNDDLRSQIMSAVAEHSGDSAAPAPAEAPEAPETPRVERNRDQIGRFAAEQAAAEAPKAPAAANTAPPAAEVAPPAPEAQAAAPAAPEGSEEPAGPPRPPIGWSVEAKAAFEALPDAVKQAVATREVQVNKGLAKLQEYKGLDQFQEMAKRSGTNLTEAVRAYHNAEEALRKDFGGGLSQLCNLFGKHPVEAAAGLLGVDPRQLVGALQGGQRQAAPQSLPQSQQPAGLDPQVAQVLARQQETINSLMQAEQGRTTQATNARTEAASSVIEAFFDHPSNPYAHNLEAEIVSLVSQDPQATKDLPGALRRAYDTAVFLNPQTRDVVINDRVKAEQARIAAEAAKQAQVAQRARQGSRSVTGSPVSGANTATGGAAPSLREELQRAFQDAR